MTYVGGVLDRSGKVAFHCCDGDLAWVLRNTQSAWHGVKRDDPQAQYFVAPLALTDAHVPVLGEAELQEACKAVRPGC